MLLRRPVAPSRYTFAAFFSSLLGGPGSGKTTIALNKALLHIEAGLEPGQSVLFLSFSRAAVARVVEASKLQLSRQQRANLDVQTFHSFFWGLIKSHAYLLGAPRKLQILMPQDERVRSGGIKHESDPSAWEAWLIERKSLAFKGGLVAFDLFAPIALELLNECSLLRELVSDKYPLVIVDEAQDTGPDAWLCVEAIARASQVICLADMEQQIFDHLPGIGPERIDDIRACLSPTEIDLGSDNLRSPGTEIAEFGRDILASRARPNGYMGVTTLPFARNANLSMVLRRALGLIKREIRRTTGEWPKTLAILVPFGSEAAKVSAALNSGLKPVAHKVMFDEDQARLAARFAGFLLEPHVVDGEHETLSCALQLLRDLKRASGSTTEATRLDNWAAKCAAGKISMAGRVQAVRAVLEQMTTETLVGNPSQDWLFVKRKLRESQDSLLADVAQQLDYIVAFNRGKRISSGLTEVWEKAAAYVDARKLIDAALAQDFIVDGLDDPDGIQVMTIHKSKGKQFDGVIVLRRDTHDGQRLISNFVWRGDASPFRRSRKILMVGVTRARAHTMLVQQAWPKCPIMSAHNLRSAFVQC